MTVQDTTPSVTHVGTGAQLSFPFTFRADDIGWLTLDYVVNFDQFILNADQDLNPGGTVEYTVAPPLAQELTVARDTFNTQELDYTRYDPFDSESHEDALDKLTMQIQDLQFYIDTTLTQTLDQLGDVNTDSKVDGSMLYWDAGTGFWEDTDSRVRFLAGIFRLDAASLFNFQLTMVNRVQMNAGWDTTYRNVANTAFFTINAGADALITGDGNLTNVIFSNFPGRIMQGGQTLAYLSEITPGITDHTLLTSIGVNTHAQIDGHIVDGTIHFTEGSIDHTAIANVGINSHGIIDSHIADASIHFTQAGIDHTGITNVGLNTHAQIDAAITTANAHYADVSIHYPDAPADGNEYVRRNNLWIIAPAAGVTDHGALTGLADDDHVQYHDGTLAYTGNLSMGNNEIHFVSRILMDRLNSEGIVIDGDPSSSALAAIDIRNTGLNVLRRIMWIQEVASNGFFLDHDATGSSPNNFLNWGNNAPGGLPAIISMQQTGQIRFDDEYTFPLLDGAAGEVLTTDGLGQLSFAPGGGGVTDHTLLTNIGVNTHAQVDTHIADTSIHFLEASIDHTAISNIGVNSHAAIDTHIADGTIHFTVGSIDHTLIANIGVNTHAQIDTHIADGTIHFTEGSIDHTAIANIGVNTHAQIDTHIADGTIHFTEGSIDHGNIAGLADDDHLQYLLLAGRAGGQTAFGGTAASENLILQGSSAANRGRVINRGGIDIEWDWTTDQITAGGIRFANVVPASGGVINANIFIQNNVTVNNALFIQSALDDNSTLTWTVAPGFAVTTLFFARQVYRSLTPAVPPAQTFVYAAQCAYDIQGAGAITVGAYRALSFAPIIRVRNAGDNLTITNVNGVTVGPLWNTNNATAIADFGTIRGVHMLNPGQALFGQSLGTERCANIVGLDMNNMTLTTSGVRAAVRSSLTNNAQNYVIQNLGGADSDFGAGDIEFNDSAGVKFGGSNDVFLFYNSAQAALTFSSFFGVTSNPLYLRPDAVDVWSFQQDNGGSLDIGLQFNVNAISFGTTTPTPNSNNWFIQFAAPNQRQVQIGGEYSDVLWTAGGSIDVDGQTVSNLQAFKINSPAVILNGGTIDDISNLFVEAMPSFGATRVQALRVLGRARIDGHQNYGARSPAQITANQNDYQLGANNAQRTMNLLDSDAAYNITGIDSSFGRAQDGDAVCLYNTGSFNLTLTHQDALSTAANRMISPTGVSYVIGPNECVWIYYDLVVARWRLLEGTGA